LRRWITASAALLALAGAATAWSAPLAAGRRQTVSNAALAYYGNEIGRLERATWHWQRVMGVSRTPAPGRSLSALDGDQIKLLDRRWQSRSAAAYRRAQHPPHLQAFLCIHRYEGSWSDGGGPYYGGLQMDVGFQQTYGGWLYRTKGTADHWAPIEQIWTAERAVRSRGFWPWPSTARICGAL
jgi:hypothetical protein